MTSMIKEGLMIVLPDGHGESIMAMLGVPASEALVSKRVSGEETLEFEGLRISEEKMLRIVLARPDAQLYKISKGRPVVVKPTIPELIPALISCPNPNCVTAQPREPTKPGFWVVRIKPLTLQCNYCERYVESGLARDRLLGT